MSTNLSSARRRLLDLLWPIEQAKQRQKRKRILVAATKMFIRNGYRKTSISAIAHEAGVAKGTVYLYYSNKAELLYHALLMEKENHLERLAPIEDPTLTPEERLRNFIALTLILNLELPLTNSLRQGDLEIDLAMQELNADVLKDINKRQIDFISSLLADIWSINSSDKEVELRTRVLLDLIWAIFKSDRMTAKDIKIEQYAWTLADVIVNGLTNPSAEDSPDYQLVAN